MILRGWRHPRTTTHSSRGITSRCTLRRGEEHKRHIKEHKRHIGSGCLWCVLFPVNIYEHHTRTSGAGQESVSQIVGERRPDRRSQGDCCRAAGQRDTIFEANQKDLRAAKAAGVAEPLVKRLVLNEPKLRDVITGIEHIAKMEDPVGRVATETELDDGLILKKVQVPIGVLAMIYESRPDAGPQIASLAIRSGNAVTAQRRPRGCTHQCGNRRLSFEEFSPGMGSEDAVQLVSSREEIAELLKMDDLINLVIPRGSNEMVRSIQQSTKIPVLGHADGVCHVYIDEFADPEKAARIAVDSKAQYPAVCNAAGDFTGSCRIRQPRESTASSEKCRRRTARFGFGSEYLDLIMNVKVVEAWMKRSTTFIKYGSAHTDCIVTENVRTPGVF